MSRLRRCLAIAGALLAVLPSSGVALAVAEEQVQEVPVAVTALDQAAVLAMVAAGEATSQWLPVTATASSQPPVGTRLVGAGAAVFGFEDGGLFDLDRVEVLSGPQGMLFGNSRTMLGNQPDADFYGTNSTATVVVAEVEGWPPGDLTELFELALAFTWAGDEVLEDSPYPGDPLLGLGNVSSHGLIGGEPFVNYANIQGGVWTQFSDPLLRFDTTTSDDRHFVGWLLPGIPSELSLAISYSPDATIDSMIAQQVDVPVPGDIATYQLTTEFDLVDPGLQSSLSTLFAPGDSEQPVDEGEPPPDTSGPAEDEEPPATEDTAGDEIAATDGSETRQAADTEGSDEEGGSSGLFIFLISLVGAAFLAWLVRWYLANRKQTSEVSTLLGAPPGGDGPMDTERSWAVEVADRHVRAGKAATQDGWFAPTFAETAQPGEPPEGEPEDWSGVFANSLTFERVGMDDPRYPGLLERFELPPPVDAPVTETEDSVIIGSDGGEEPVQAGEQPQPAGTEAAFRTHAGPSQVMTASEEAIGIAEELVGVVVDGWHLLPWDVGSDFFVPQGHTTAYRTIPVVNKDVATDVEFLGTPPGFESDSTRFGYWMNDDGVLKIGSPTDPHAFPIETEPVSLESLLPTPGPGETLDDVIVARLLRAHELAGGAHPVDGWIALSNQARTVAMLLDDVGRPGYDPEAWSGQFLNVETGAWLHPGQLGYDDMAQRLGVRPEPKPPKPIESTEPLDLDDTPGSV